MSYHQPTKQAAKGKWRGILQACGVNESFLSGRNGPCPACGGNDRWQWINDNGDGGGVCRGCGGKADGIHLLMAVDGIEWKEAARKVDDVLGNHAFKADAPKPELDDAKRKAMLREVWQASRETRPGDLAHEYLASRRLDRTGYHGLRTSDRLWHSRELSGDVFHPAMIGVISDVNGKPVSLHRTYLDGKGGRLDRKMMPGSLPDGACIRLSPLAEEQDVIGVAEGIETALAASALFELPVWAVLNTSMMKNWLVPAGVREVAIFGDNDPSFAGESAAIQLAEKLYRSGVTVNRPLIPAKVGTDWADEWKSKA